MISAVLAAIAGTLVGTAAGFLLSVGKLGELWVEHRLKMKEGEIQRSFEGEQRERDRRQAQANRLADLERNEVMETRRLLSIPESERERVVESQRLRIMELQRPIDSWREAHRRLPGRMEMLTVEDEPLREPYALTDHEYQLLSLTVRSLMVKLHIPGDRWYRVRGDGALVPWEDES